MHKLENYHKTNQAIIYKVSLINRFSFINIHVSHYFKPKHLNLPLKLQLENTMYFLEFSSLCHCASSVVYRSGTIAKLTFLFNSYCCCTLNECLLKLFSSISWESATFSLSLFTVCSRYIVLKHISGRTGCVFQCVRMFEMMLVWLCTKLISEYKMCT